MARNSEHPFDPFCPESLVLYQSQDLPDLMTFLNNQHPVRLDQVKIEEGQKSRRLDQEMLEKSWTRNISQQAPMRVPFWANADPVVQSILRQDICWNASPSPSQPPSSIPILLHGEPATISPTTARTSMSTRAESQSHAPYLAAAIPSDSPPSDAADVNRDKRKSKGNAGRRTTTNPKAPKEVAGRRLKRDSRIAKRSWRPAMGLRSRTSQNFAS